MSLLDGKEEDEWSLVKVGKGRMERRDEPRNRCSRRESWEVLVVDICAKLQSISVVCSSKKTRNRTNQRHPDRTLSQTRRVVSRPRLRRIQRLLEYLKRIKDQLSRLPSNDLALKDSPVAPNALTISYTTDETKLVSINSFSMSLCIPFGNSPSSLQRDNQPSQLSSKCC